jgi:site-specific DNA recombinase
MTAPIRGALYLRVSTGRQADNDLSIPDQRRQAKGYCTSRGWEIVADYVEPGASATDDRRPEFQRMIDAAAAKPPMFNVILVHSFSRFFRDQFQLEFYIRRLAKNGVRLISITQELGDDPMSSMIRRSWRCSTNTSPRRQAHPAGNEGKRPFLERRAAADRLPHRRGRTARPPHQEDPRDRSLSGRDRATDFPLGVGGDGTSGPMGVKSITNHLNASGIRTRDGGRWALAPSTRY